MTGEMVSVEAITAVPAEAIEVAARANYEYDRDVREIRWQRGTWEKLDATERGWYLSEAERGLTAAAPLLRAPLVAEVKRLTAIVEAVEKVRDEWAVTRLVRGGSRAPIATRAADLIVQQLTAALSSE